MRLKRFSTDSFAGIKNTRLSFQDGMNVVLGPNEAGKSTAIEAIFATIFQEKIKLNTREGKEFKERFMPYPDGEYINGNLEFEVNGEEYRLLKEWGDEHSSILELPDGQRIKSEEKINQYLKDLFKFGQATYANVVFARQNDVKQAIQNIISDDSIINTVSAFLRKAVMELEGISIEKLKNKIDNELEQLVKKWDIENNRPENPNRDINNPFKIGFGDIYDLYIKKASIEMEMDRTKELEEKIKNLSEEIKELKKKREIVSIQINELAKLEDDIFKRGSIEPEIKRLEEKSKLLKKINHQWPLKEDQLKRKKEELNGIKKKIEELKEEKKKAAQKVEREQLKALLEKLDKLKSLKEEKEKQQASFEKVMDEDIKDLETLDGKLKKTEAFLEASTLIGKVNKSSQELVISSGIGEKETISAGEEFRANAYLRIEIDDLLDIEIQSAEIDFAELKTEYQDIQEKLEKKLAELKVKNISEAKLKKEKYTSLLNDITNLNKQIDNLLDGREYKILKEKLESLNELEAIRDIEIIDDELEKVNNSRVELLGDAKSISEQLEAWQSEYGEADDLLDQLIEIRADLKSYQKELAKLAELPEEYQSAEEFKSQLSSLRGEKDSLDNEFYERKEALSNLTTELADESYEELETRKLTYQRDFDAKVKKARNLIKIKEVINKELDAMDENTFTPLLDSFSKYLSILTVANYNLGEINDDFHLKIINQDEKALPVDIRFLSFGTYDAVALAFRFALIEQLFEDGEGFIVLDDCLVNLDPERKRKAVEVIQKFSNDFQLIFTSCNPDTAQDLGGNIIEL
ncbi:ATP-binding protein [Natronospora cellulosivora (SeqCode)]